VTALVGRHNKEKENYTSAQKEMFTEKLNGVLTGNMSV
jgi:hypothetical protein